MRKPVVTLDWETEGIQARPVYPPKPVGLAVYEVGKPKIYMAFGHPCENNCTELQAKKVVKSYQRSHNCIYHNSAFDIEIAYKYSQAQPPKYFEDTLFLAFLYDPRDKAIGLKSLAEKYLGMSSEEQNNLKDWILENTDCKDTKKDPWGAHIAEAPGKLVGKYAIGDVVRTYKLFKFYMPSIKEMGMLESYVREKKVMPIFEKISTVGLKTSVRKLKTDIRKFEKHHKEIENDIKRNLRCSDLDIKSSKQLASVLDKRNKIDTWIYTKPSETFPNGQKSTSRDNILAGCNDKKLIYLLSRYGILSTYLSTFMNPWLEKSEKYGRIYPTFNQVRSADNEGNSVGTRTGRPSSSNPNLLNVPRNTDDLEKYKIGLPWMRNYILPDEDCVLNGRDYSQQEIRILAHFSEGPLLEAYQKNPTMDVHQYTIGLVKQMTGITLQRKTVKVLAFAMIYGMGVLGLSKKLNIEKSEAGKLKKAYLNAFPSIKELSDDLRGMGSRGEPLRTWGGRLYWKEESKKIDGVMRDFAYKMLNYLIQPSAADITKQAMINIDEYCDYSRLMLQVYDETLNSSEKGKQKSEMVKITECMEAVKLDLPMLTDGKTSAISWGKMKKCK